MLLPQSSAFVSLRNRLSAVNSAGFLHIAPKSYVALVHPNRRHTNECLRTMSNITATRSKLGREDIKWSELLSHFRSVQNRHEKARRQSTGDNDVLPASELSSTSDKTAGATGTTTVNGSTTRPAVRRRVTGTGERPPSRALSPLNPRSRIQGTSGPSALGPAGMGQSALPPTLTAGGPSSPTFVQTQKQPTSKRTLSISRKT